MSAQVALAGSGEVDVVWGTAGAFYHCRSTFASNHGGVPFNVTDLSGAERKQHVPIMLFRCRK